MPVEVNGEVISNADIRAEMNALRLEREHAGEEVSLEQRLALRDEAIAVLIERTLLVQEARRLGIRPSPEEIDAIAASLAPRSDGISGCRAGADVEGLRREAERRLTIDALIDHWAKQLPAPSAGEVRKFYRDNREHMQFPEMVRASHLVKNFEGEDRAPQREQIARLRERLIAGEDFAELARAESDCPENGGDLGWFPQGTMVQEFDDVVFKVEPGQVTEVFETRFGVHVAIVHERRAAGIPALEDIENSIQERLRLTKIDRELGKRIEALRARASVREVA